MVRSRAGLKGDRQTRAWGGNATRHLFYIVHVEGVSTTVSEGLGHDDEISTP